MELLKNDEVNKILKKYWPVMGEKYSDSNMRSSPLTMLGIPGHGIDEETLKIISDKLSKIFI